MAANQSRSPIAIGYLAGASVGGMSTVALSAAATWITYGFNVNQANPLSKIRAYISAVTGTLAAGEITCDLCSDNNAGMPGTIIQTSTTTTAAITAAAWAEWTGFTEMLLPGVQYWLVFKNLNATPASNFPTLSMAASGYVPNWANSSSATYGWNRKQSANSGSTWASPITSTGSLRLEFDGGIFDGSAIQGASFASGASDRVYVAREVGVKFTTPADVRYNVRGVGFFTTTTGAPTGDYRCRLYTGESPTILATSTVVPKGNFATGIVQWTTAYFTASLLIEPGTVLRVVIGETTNSDASSVFYGIPAVITIEDDVNSRALLPFDGTLQKTLFDGTTWAETNTVVYPFAMLLDTNDPYGTSGGAGAIFNPFNPGVIRGGLS